MNYFSPFIGPYNSYRGVELPKSYKPLEEALDLAKSAVQGEREDELFYDYLISVAPTEEEQKIIATIRDDERKHNKYFREIFSFFTGQTIPSPSSIDFEKPKSYIDGIKKAKFGELAAMERYRIIRAGLLNEYYRDMVFEILTDEMKHAHKYDYILYLNLEKKHSNNNLGNNNNMSWRNSVPTTQVSFTTEEALQIAKTLGINFSLERFDVEQFRMGLNTELEHGKKYLPTNVTWDDPIITGKIALAHLREYPDYYTRLAKLEEEAKAYWEGMPRYINI